MTNLLIETNQTWLRQALALLHEIDDRTYTATPDGLAPHRASGHLRHILEFYDCFLDGVKSSCIDYDARRRDESIERSRAAAIARIKRIIERLQTVRPIHSDTALRVRIEDADATGIRDCFITSSVGRELQVLSSHTIHHFALIAMTLRSLGVTMDPTFGMAPSTLRYSASKSKKKAA